MDINIPLKIHYNYYPPEFAVGYNGEVEVTALSFNGIELSPELFAEIMKQMGNEITETVWDNIALDDENKMWHEMDRVLALHGEKN